MIISIDVHQVFEDGLDPDSLFDRLKEETVAEKKPVVKTPKPRKVGSKHVSYFSTIVKDVNYILYYIFVLTATTGTNKNS